MQTIYSRLKQIQLLFRCERRVCGWASNDLRDQEHIMLTYNCTLPFKEIGTHQWYTIVCFRYFLCPLYVNTKFLLAFTHQHPYTNYATFVCTYVRFCFAIGMPNSLSCLSRLPSRIAFVKVLKNLNFRDSLDD